MNAPLIDQLPPPPRALGLVASVRAIGYELLSSAITMVGGTFLLVGLAMTAILVLLIRRDLELRREGIEVPGTVTGAYATTRTESGGDRRIYEVEYRFLLPSGRSWTGLQEVSLDTWNRVRTGEPFTVRYDRRNPSRNELPMDHSNWLNILLGGFSAVLDGLGASMLYFGAREILEPLRLYRRGVSTTGRVVDLELVTSESVNDRHPTLVVYQFRDASGTSVRGAAKTLDDEFLAKVDRGSQVTVLYDPARPALNALFAAIGIAADDAGRAPHLHGD